MITTPKHLKLVTINVWFGMDGRGVFKIGDYEDRKRKESRVSILLSGLRQMKPDVIAVQEANKLPAYAKKMATFLDYDFVWKVQNSGVKFMGFGIPVNFTAGNAILAKKDHHLKFLAAQRLSGRGIQRNYLSVHFKELRNAMAASVEIDSAPIVIFNTQTHFSLIPDEKWEKALMEVFQKDQIARQEYEEIKTQMRDRHNRTEQDIIKLLCFIKRVIRKYDYPYVLMGDFNTTTKSSALQTLITELKLLDPFRIKNPDLEGYTWDPKRNTNTAYDGSYFWADGKTPRGPLSRLTAEFDATTPRRIDFIFLSKHFAADHIHQANLIFTEPVDDIFVSDHFGVRVDLKALPKYKK
jgi:endonuclease/exonuclease/phosphatase family metal-dependent hydrolase